MSFNFIVFVLCGFFLVNFAQGETYTIDEETGAITLADKKCTEFGPICTNCSTLAYCIESSNGNWIMQTIATCDAKKNETCNSALLQCSTEKNYACEATSQPTNFVCHGIGLFPDPISCSTYHLCVPENETNIDSGPRNKSIVMTCPVGYGFDIVSSTCRMNLAITPCPAPITCENSTMKAFAKNPSFYYWCLSKGSVPQMFLCPRGLHMINNKCLDPPALSSSSGYCPKKGFFADPINCRAFNECPAENVLPYKRTCPNNQYYSYVSEKCVDFTCESFLGK